MQGEMTDVGWLGWLNGFYERTNTIVDTCDSADHGYSDLDALHSYDYILL